MHGGTGRPEQKLSRKQLQRLLWNLEYDTLSRGRPVIFGETVVVPVSSSGSGGGGTPRRAVLMGMGGHGFVSVEWIDDVRIGARKVYVPEASVQVAPESEQRGLFSKVLATEYEEGAVGMSKADFVAYCEQDRERTVWWFRHLRITLGPERTHGGQGNRLAWD